MLPHFASWFKNNRRMRLEWAKSRIDMGGSPKQGRHCGSHKDDLSIPILGHIHMDSCHARQAGRRVDHEHGYSTITLKRLRRTTWKPYVALLMNIP